MNIYKYASISIWIGELFSKDNIVPKPMALGQLLIPIFKEEIKSNYFKKKLFSYHRFRELLEVFPHINSQLLNRDQYRHAIVFSIQMENKVLR